MNFFKSKLNEFQSEAKANFAIFKKLISELDVRNNKLETELSENTKTIKMRYTNR
jgi:predicted RNase H-like nuclease (RuvC/YqgF family)